MIYTIYYNWLNNAYYIYYIMFGLGVNLVKIFNYLQSRKYKKCIFCNKYFKDKTDLDNHIGKEHNSTSETGTINR